MRAYMRKKYTTSYFQLLCCRYCMMTIRPYVGKHTYVTSRLKLAFTLNMRGMQVNYSSEPSPTCACLTLTAKVLRGHRLAEVETACKIAQVEVLTHLRCKHRAPSQLLVEHQDNTVDAHGGAWVLIWYELSACHLIQKKS